MWPRRAHTQQAATIKRLGLLRVGPLPKDWNESFRQGLRDHGLAEGQGYSVELGVVEHGAQIPEALAQLIRQKVDVIIASGVPSVLPAREGAGSIPVVFIFSGDPVAMGLAATLARPGGNLTGVTVMDSTVTAKRFQLLKELVPGLSKAALVLRTQGPENDRYIEEGQRAQRDLGLQVQVLVVPEADALARTLDKARDVRALVVVGDAQFTVARTRIAELALKLRLPTMFTHPVMVEAGGLMSYGPDYQDLYRQAAGHVYKILQGTKPGDIPVEQPTRFEQVINLKTAKTLGITIPPVLLVNATRVIE
jgi:putative ABC transport system substrate-binding protein